MLFPLDCDLPLVSKSTDFITNTKEERRGGADSGTDPL